MISGDPDRIDREPAPDPYRALRPIGFRGEVSQFGLNDPVNNVDVLSPMGTSVRERPGMLMKRPGRKVSPA
jgi:hypothetical protein